MYAQYDFFLKLTSIQEKRTYSAGLEYDTMVHILLDPYNSDKQMDGPNVTPEREEASRRALEGYEADLVCRFQDGGDWDTNKIVTGETFVEIVCGGYMNGFLPVRCYEPLMAVQLFIDAMERYFATLPERKTLHWRVRPEWKSHCVEEVELWHSHIDGGITSVVDKQVVRRTIYSIYARLVLV